METIMRLVPPAQSHWRQSFQQWNTFPDSNQVADSGKEKWGYSLLWGYHTYCVWPHQGNPLI